MPSNHLILCCHLLLLPSIFPSIRIFSNESALHIRWPKYWSFRFSINPSNEHSGLISFRMDWLDLLAVQGALKSFLQHLSSKASILWHSAFFFLHSPTLTSIHDYWKNHSLDYISPTPQFKSINSSALSFLYSPTLTSIHDHWKNHSFEKTDVCWQSNVSAF